MGKLGTLVASLIGLYCFRAFSLAWLRAGGQSELAGRRVTGEAVLANII